MHLISMAAVSTAPKGRLPNNVRNAIIILVCWLCGAGCDHQPVSNVKTKEPETLPFYASADFSPTWIAAGEHVPDSMHVIPAFSFIDQDGDTISNNTVKGKIYVADFFFTSCPGICPKLTKNLKRVQDSFLLDNDVILLSHSVTPEKDDAPTLNRYAKNYGVQKGKWHLLTGNRDSIYRVARQGYFADEDLGQQRSADDFLHTENMLLVDRKGRIRGIYKGLSPQEMNNMIADIRLLKKEPF